MRDHDPAPRYELLEPIGEGGFAEVRRARDRVTGAAVVVKRAREPGAEADARFAAEFALVAPLAHPGIARALDYLPAGGNEPAALVFEAVDGGSSAERCREASAATLFGWAACLAETLSFLHEAGLVHGDLKPENVVVSREGRPQLIDFGLAGRPGAHAGGSVAYAAPETLARGHADARSDLYALGATLFAWLFGRPPHGTTLAARLAALPRRPALPASPPLPRPARELLRDLLAPEPDDRPATARAVVERLAAAGFSLPFPELADPRARAGALPLVAREAALAALAPAYGPADHGFFALIGPRGAGHSRLAGEVARRARLAGRRVIAGSAAEVVQALGSASPAVGLAALAEDGPVTLVVDDARRLDGALRAALEELPQRLARVPGVAVVVAGGDADDPRGLPVGWSGVVLPPLDGPAAARVADALLAGPPVSATLAERLARAAGGRAGPLVALLAHAVDARLVVPGAAGWDKGRLESAALFDLLPDDDASETLGGLSAAERALLAALAARGEPSPLGTLALGAGLTAAAAADAARALVARRLARREATGALAPAPGAERAAGALEPQLRAAVHARLFARRAAERLPPGAEPLARAARLAELARHAAGAGRLARAGPLARSAVRAALAAGRPELARAALAALPRAPRAGPARGALGEAGGDAELAAGRPESAAEHYADAVEAYLAAGRGPSAALARARLGRALGDLGGRDGRAAERAREAFERARREAALPRVAALVRIEEGIFHARQGDYRAALESLDEALRLAPRGGEAEARARAARGRCLVLAERVREGEAELDRALPVARAAGDQAVIAAILSARVQAALRDGRSRQVLDLAPELRRLLLARGDPDALALLFATVSDAARALGQLDQALAAARTALRWREVHGHRRWLGAAHQRLATILFLLGDLDGAARALRAALARALTEGAPADRVAALALSARLAAVRGDAVRAARAARRAEEAARTAAEPRLELDAAIATAWAARARRDDDAAAEALREPVERLRREAADPPALAEALALRAGATAVAEPVTAARLARRALALAERRGDFEAAQLALDALERALVAGGDDEAATRARGWARARLAEAAAALGSAAEERRFLERPDRQRRMEGAGPSDRRRLETLYELLAELNSRRDPGEVLETLLDRALAVLGAERGAVVLLRDGQLEVASSRQIERETKDDALRLSRTVLARARGGESLLVPDAAHDPRLAGATSVRLFAIRAVLCVPLRHKEATAGALYLDTRDPARQFDRHDLEFLEALAHHAALALENARAFARLARENERLRADLAREVGIGAMAGKSAQLARLVAAIEAAAPTGLPVLVSGESGSGKELVARALHARGPRAEGPFVAVNCAAVPETILEATLFGHARGAFTGADRARPGLLVQAAGGTLFLDEIGDMPPAMQAKLLRALEERAVRPVGAAAEVPLDFRLVAATHRDLGAEVKAGRFRADLLFRIDVLRLAVPPLRERIEDLPLLARRLLERLAPAGAAPLAISDGLLARLAAWDWPGNVRELENVLARLSLHARRGVLDEDALACDAELARQFGVAPAPDGAPASLDRAERDAIRRALEITRGNRERAARLLGIGRATIFRKIRQLGLEDTGRAGDDPPPGVSP
ncbi:MAG: sigma 54-interacting transcriptional regulator [Acidobacteria bacterium]|nr:sigma 54-interacting transcriptional regulator [Acidobacteriota bacterium]